MTAFFYFKHINVYNLPPNVCDVLICDSSSPNTRNQMVFSTQGNTDLNNCGRPVGIATATQDSIDIQYVDFLDNEKFYHFRGKKIK